MEKFNPLYKIKEKTLEDICDAVREVGQYTEDIPTISIPTMIETLNLKQKPQPITTVERFLTENLDEEFLKGLFSYSHLYGTNCNIGNIRKISLLEKKQLDLKNCPMELINEWGSPNIYMYVENISNNYTSSYSANADIYINPTINFAYYVEE